MGKPIPSLLVLSCLALPASAAAQACQTFFVDSNTPTGNFARAISDVNTLGCPSGGFNTIIIDNIGGGFGDTVIANPLPEITRPARIQLASTSGARHVIRSNNSTNTSLNFGLRASARVEINDIIIQGGGGRAFFGGILLTGSGADDSLIQGVRVENVRHQGIFVNNVTGVDIRRSLNHPVEVIGSGWGVNADSPAFEPGILINGSTSVNVFGTFIGVEQDGTDGGNCSYGIEVANSTLVQIGGTSLGSVNLRNHIGTNRFGGVRVHNSNVISILANYIGLAPNGQSAVGNGTTASCFGASPPSLVRGGVVITDSNFVSLGSGTHENSGPAITSNQRGVHIGNSNNVTVLRSLIGQRPTGQSAPNSGEAVRVEDGSGLTGTVLLGSSEVERVNVIRGGASSTWGVVVTADSGRVDIRRNAIWGFSNGAINRVGAPNPPTLTSAIENTGVVTGTLTVVPDPGEIDFYADMGAQGRWYIGTHAVAANASSFSAQLSAPEFITGNNITASFSRFGTIGVGKGTSRLSAAIPASSEIVIHLDGFEGF